jgi:hypothetical protein
MHVTDPLYLPDGVQHRVVAVNATQGATWNQEILPPHHCYLELTSDISAALQRAAPPLSFDQTLGSTGGMRFDGYCLTVANANGSPLTRLNWDLVPSLTEYSDMTLLPSIPEPGAPTWADCYVDINQGTLIANAFRPSPQSKGGGIYTTWTVETDGDPILQLIGQDGKVLTVAAVDGGAKLSTPDKLTLSNAVPGSVVLHNSTTDSIDKQFDFALYYLARVGGIPDKFKKSIPSELVEAEGALSSLPIPVSYTDMTPSCSNSRYP